MQSVKQDSLQADALQADAMVSLCQSTLQRVAGGRTDYEINPPSTADGYAYGGWINIGADQLFYKHIDEVSMT